MPKKPETRLQRKIHLHLEKRFRCKFFKIWGGPFMEAGLPDLVGCVDGLFIALEVKRDASDSEASIIQLSTLKAFRAVGAFACVVCSEAEATAVVRAAKRISEEGGGFCVDPEGGRPILRPEDWEDLYSVGRRRTTGVSKRTSRRPAHK